MFSQDNVILLQVLDHPSVELCIRSPATDRTGKIYLEHNRIVNVNEIKQLHRYEFRENPRITILH